MFKTRRLIVGLVVSATVACAVAQMPPDGGPGGFFPGGGQNGDLRDIQTQIRASDEEWKVIGPKLQRLIRARAAVETGIEDIPTGFTGDMGGRGGRGMGPGGFGNDSFSNPGERGGGPGRGGFGRGGFGPEGGDPNMFGPRPEGFGRGGRGPGGFTPGGPPGSDPNMFARGGRGRGGFGPGGPGGFDPNAFGRGGRGMEDSGPGGFGRGGRGPGGDMGGGPMGFGGSNNAVSQALIGLRTTLADPNAGAEQIKEKVTAVRSVRHKAMAELTAAQKDLLQMLTVDQEAVLVSLGYSD